MTTATTGDERLTETFAALANPTRRAILARLAEGEASVNEIARPFAMSLPAISRHIRVLERAGLISQGQRAQYRPCTIATEPLQAVADWTDQYRPIWEDRFDRMADYLDRIQRDPDDAPATDHPTPDHLITVHSMPDHPGPDHPIADEPESPNTTGDTP